MASPDPAVTRDERCPACGVAAGPGLGYPDFTVRVCPACRLQWAAPLGKGSGTVRHNYYMEAGSYGDPAVYPPFLAFFRFLEARFGQRPLRILDIGCGRGIFLAECRRRGHDAFGIEADPGLRDRMPPEIAARVRFQFAEEALDLAGEYDCISFWDSFEHLPEPFPLLDRLNRHLRPEGVFYLRVNNEYDVYNLVARALLTLLPGVGRQVFRSCFGLPFHYWNFSRVGLTRILEARGFPILDYRIGETPAFRLSRHRLVVALIRLAYAANRAIGGGKIANVYLARKP